MDFLAKSNSSGQIILKLVARGNSILAELMRLSDYIPVIFCFETKAHQKIYEDVFPDFVYFKSPVVFENKIEKSQVLHDLDKDMKENHGDMVIRLYSAFEGIYQYIIDLLNFLQEINEGIYFQITLENIFSDEDGQQLMCEALYLYGCMLLITESNFPGLVRERIIVAYHRHFGHMSSNQSNLEEVSKLLRSTGYSKTQPSKKVSEYPENYFARVPISEEYVDLVIGYLQSNDIYHQICLYPSPEHRTTALSTQAAMLFVCLYFSPKTLHSQSSRMREIVDKFFSDQWVISYYMGNSVNLIHKWDNYKAAKTALNNTITTDRIREKTSQIHNNFTKYLKQTRKFLCEGKLTEFKLLEHSSKILNMLRHCNVILHWIFLHCASLQQTGGENNKRCISVRAMVVQELEFDQDLVLKLLVNTSEVELSLTETYKKLIEEKDTKWEKYKKLAEEETTALSEAFSESQPLNKVRKNDKLHSWFKDLSQQIRSLSLDDSTSVGRKIIQIIQALKEVKEFHELDASAGIIQAVCEVVTNLQALLKVLSINDDDLVALATISDISYAWRLIDSYTTTIQESIKRDPSEVARLRATFLKLSSGLELPLLRINQANSPDIVSVSAYYSGQLVEYIRKILQIIPEKMFRHLEQIIDLQTTMEEIPTKISVEDVKTFSQLDKRFKLADLTEKVSMLSEGVSMMESTLVGVVEIDPKQLLEDGIRRQLVLQVATHLHQNFIFNPKAKGCDLTLKLDQMCHSIRGYQVSFEYIQDYINIHGLKMWNEEMRRIIKFNVQQECNQLMKKKLEESYFKDAKIPVPSFTPVDTQSINFVGRLLREVIRVTNPRTTAYIDQTNSWFDTKTHEMVLDNTVFEKVEKCLSPAGLVGLDRILAFLISQHLQELEAELHDRIIKDEASKLMETYHNFENFLLSQNCIIRQPQKHYKAFFQKTQKINSTILDLLLKVGQMQTLRILINNQLVMSCQYHSNLYQSVVKNFNDSLLFDLKTNPTVDDHSEKIASLRPLLQYCGICEPLKTVYFVPKPFKLLSVALFGVVAAASTKMYFDRNLASLMSTKLSDGFDGTPLATGSATLLRQFHPDHTTRFIKVLSQYSKSFSLSVNPNSTVKETHLSVESHNSLVLFKHIATLAGVPSGEQEKYFPPSLFSAHAI